MSAVDRVMLAYAQKHELSSKQAAFVRSDLKKFIESLLAEAQVVPVREAGDSEP